MKLIEPRKSPQIDDAPGLVWKSRKNGWEGRWQARTDLAKRGYSPKSVRLWCGEDPSTTERGYIADQCQRLQSEMLVWGRGGVPVVSEFDGTVGSLVRCYQTDQDSTYRKARHASRKYYDTLCRRIENDCGTSLISEIKARAMLRLHEGWSESGIPMAHALVGMLRTLTNFGATILEDEECDRLSGVLHKMKFKMGKPRSEILTAEQVEDIRDLAHRLGRHSIALAQAIQFECTFRQKDVIGEYVPISEPGTSDITSGNNKWLRGIRWSEIDSDLILRHTTSKRQKDVEIDLKRAPMVLEEFARLGRLPTSGAVVINERTGQPFYASEFRRLWRQIADDCDVPKNVRNMDSRAGAISEALASGARLQSVRKAATHSTEDMTQKYSRGDAEEIAEVMQLRAAGRNKPGKQSA